MEKTRGFIVLCQPKTEKLSNQNNNAGQHRHFLRPLFKPKIANSQKRNYCRENFFRRLFTNINSAVDFYTFCKVFYNFLLIFLLSHSAGKTHRETLLCLRKLLVLKTVEDKNEREGAARFVIEDLLLTVPENITEETVCLSETFWIRLS